MTYSQLRNEIRGTVDAILNPYKVHVSDMAVEQIMTAIDTYLEEEAIRVESVPIKHFCDIRDIAAAIIRSKQ
jgi:hypothetical protein